MPAHFSATLTPHPIPQPHIYTHGSSPLHTISLSVSPTNTSMSKTNSFPLTIKTTMILVLLIFCNQAFTAPRILNNSMKPPTFVGVTGGKGPVTSSGPNPQTYLPAAPPPGPNFPAAKTLKPAPFLGVTGGKGPVTRSGPNRRTYLPAPPGPKKAKIQY